jgi:hypothetical protein
MKNFPNTEVIASIVCCPVRPWHNSVAIVHLKFISSHSQLNMHYIRDPDNAIHRSYQILVWFLSFIMFYK